MNSETYSLYKDLNIVGDIKIRRLRWVGHIIRMAEERIPPPKKIDTKWKIAQNKSVGKPRTRWKDVVHRS